jgi:hypothetical protein
MVNARVVNAALSCAIHAHSGAIFRVFARIARLRNPVKYTGSLSVNGETVRLSAPAASACQEYLRRISDIVRR